MKQVSTIITALTVLLLCSCGPDREEKYLYLRPVTTLYDTLKGNTVKNDVVQYNDLLVKVTTPISRYYTMNKSFHFFNSAYAMHKNMDRLTSIEKISKLRIITLKDYNTIYPAGSDMSAICLFAKPIANRDSNKYNPLPGDTLSSSRLISYMNENYKAYDYYGQLPNTEFVFMLTQPPATQSEHRFAIVFETATPSRFSDTTISFTLKP